MNSEQIYKLYERDAKSYAKVASHIPPRIVESAYLFAIKHSNTPTEQLELDFCPKRWRGDRNFVDILANPTAREWIFDTVTFLADAPDKTRTLLSNCKLEANAQGQEFRRQIFYMLCMALVGVIVVKKHLAFSSSMGLN